MTDSDNLIKLDRVFVEKIIKAIDEKEDSLIISNTLKMLVKANKDKIQTKHENGTINKPLI